MKSLGFLMIIALLSFKCGTDEDILNVQNIPNDYILEIENRANDNQYLEILPDSTYNLVESLPVNFDTTGKTDYTSIIQKVLDENRLVTFPGFPLLINPNGLTISSDSKIYFNKGSKLLFKENDKERYEVLRLHEVQNIELLGPNITGDRNNHFGTSGEWGFGISIRGSKNISIYNGIIKDCWGDGIYLGSMGADINENIWIRNCFVDNNRRNGISIISGINLNIVDCLITNTEGTFPMSGIDIEPNTNEEELKNISIINTKTYNNAKEGILIALQALQGVNPKVISIKIENHIDEYSKYAMGFAIRQESSNMKNDITGSINVKNSVWKNNTSKLVRFHNHEESKINLNFVTPRIIHSDHKFLNEKKEELIQICSTNDYFSFVE